MIAVFLQIFPFFALIGLGFALTKYQLMPEATGEVLTKFVFMVALPAMLFRFASNLDVYEIFDAGYVLAFWLSGSILFALVYGVARWRGEEKIAASMEAQCSVFGNSGFMAIPMLLGIFGERAIGPLMLSLSVDVIFFGSLIVILIAVAREGELKLRTIGRVFFALVKNPMVMGMLLGVIWTLFSLEIASPIDEVLNMLSSAATPCALFVIGVSLASKAASRMNVSLWISLVKLVLHPALAAFFALVVFNVDPFAASVMIGVAAMPVASNIYIVASHYGAAPERVSSAIFVSTLLSLLTLTAVLAWL